MAGRIGDCLADDAQHRNLGRSGKRRQVADLDTDGEPLTRHALGQLGKRLGQAQVVECRGAQVVHDASYVAYRALHLFPQSLRQLSRRRIRSVGEVTHALELKGDRGELRPETVVQVASQSTPLLLASDDDSLARQTQVSTQ